MNLPVKRPANDEAGAMGGAIQALWMLEEEKKPSADPKATIARLCDEHVTINNDDCNMPDPVQAAAYDKAYAAYNKYLKALSPLGNIAYCGTAGAGQVVKGVEQLALGLGI